MTLKDMVIGDRAVVSGFAPGCRKYRARLLAMGLTRGTSVEIIRMAPMGDPIEIELRGFRLTLRKDEAEVILMEKFHHKERHHKHRHRHGAKEERQARRRRHGR